MATESITVNGRVKVNRRKGAVGGSRQGAMSISGARGRVSVAVDIGYLNEEGLWNLAPGAEVELEIGITKR